MKQDLVLVAGATGTLGREVVREFKERGERVRALVRNPARAAGLRDLADEIVVADALRPETLPDAFRGVDRIFSCLGACVIPLPQYGRTTFTRLDYPANRNLIRAAEDAGARKFVYVSVFGHRQLPQTDFIRGHELVVEELRASRLDYAVVRPTGFFSAMEEILLVASRGLLPQCRGGIARTNPIHEADLATLCVDAFEQPNGWEQDAGGPDVLPRREIARLAWEALGGPKHGRAEARAIPVPVGVLRNAGRLMLPFNPRVGNLFIFIADILVDDFVAPCFGTRHIADYFRERAAEITTRSSRHHPEFNARTP